MVNDKSAEKLEYENKIMNRKKVAGELKMLVNKMGMDVECVRVLRKNLLVLNQM